MAKQYQEQEKIMSNIETLVISTADSIESELVQLVLKSLNEAVTTEKENE